MEFSFTENVKKLKYHTSFVTTIYGCIPPSPSNPTHTLFLRHEVQIRSSQSDINVINPKYPHNPDNQRSSQNFFLIYKVRHLSILCRCMLFKGDNSQIKHGKYPQRSGIHNTAGIEYLKDTKRILNF